MKTPLIMSISGVRGIIGDSLNPDQAVSFGLSFGTFLKQTLGPTAQPRICIGRDSRPSGPMISAAISAGLMACGCAPIELGIVTTPGVALMTRHLKCNAGIVITASHNPIEYNGIKFLRHDGIAFPADQVKALHKIYHEKSYQVSPSIGCATAESNDESHDVHLAAVLKICDAQLIAEKKFKVVLDSVNGAGCIVTPRLLEKLGCELIHLNAQPTGIFAHTPEPTAENLADLGQSITQHNAQIGFAQDPDADRLALIDENGKYIGEEYTLALVAKYIFSKQKGSAAVNLSTSRMIDDLAAATGNTVIRTPVGEAHVANTMVANNCIIGGEGNGGIIDLRVGPVRDSLVGIALVLQLMAETGNTLSELVTQIPSYALVKTKFPCPADQVAPTLEKVVSHYQKASDDAKIDTRDGIRVDLPNAWLQLRGSNTEPIMRIMAESAELAQAEELIKQVQSLI